MLFRSGQVFAAASSETGNYTVSQLPIGDYDMTIAVSGFKTYSHTNFHLAAAQVMREDVALEVGQTTESVTVTAEASLLKTETSQVVQNVTLSQLNNLPVLVVGATASGVRDPFASARLVPGVNYTNGQPGATAVIAQIETAGALAEVEAIAATPGRGTGRGTERLGTDGSVGIGWNPARAGWPGG